MFRAGWLVAIGRRPWRPSLARRARVTPVVASVLSVLSASVTAHAYCRTTTTPIPIGYDPTVTGCITEGLPLSWPSMPVSFELNEEASAQVSLAEATPIFDRSFAKWAAVDCASSERPGADGGAGAGVSPALSFQDDGPTDAGYAACEAGPCGTTATAAPHVIIFRDDAWPYNDPSNTLALTTITFGEETGHIYAADMEINTHEHMISTTVPPPQDAYSLEAIATHEAGHFIGMAHSPVDSAVMFARYQPDAVTLTADDVSGVCAIYPPSSPGKARGCSIAGGTDDGEREAFGSSAWLSAALLAVLASYASGARKRRTQLRER